MQVNEKDPLSLICISDIHVYKSTTLSKNSVELPTTTTSDTKTMRKQYKVESVTLADSGKYKCTGYLKRGGNKIREVNVVVKSKCYCKKIFFCNSVVEYQSYCSGYIKLEQYTEI